MNRAQRRAMKHKSKVPTYVLNKDQIKQMQIDSAADILSVLFTLPCAILMECKASPDYIEAFADRLGEMYTDWTNDELDLNELKEEIWNYAGLRFERG